MQSIKNIIDLEDETYKQRKSALLEKINIYKHIIKNTSCVNLSSNNSIKVNKSLNNISEKVKITNNTIYENYESNKTIKCKEMNSLEFFYENKNNYYLDKKVNKIILIYLFIK
jgi:hypothetical protein